MPRIPCIECGVPCSGTRCPECARTLAQKRGALRGSSTARGYGRDWQLLRRAILDRDGWTCYRCGKALAGSDATVDHMTPLSADRSQRLEATNLAACCRSCNSSKGSRTY